MLENGLSESTSQIAIAISGIEDLEDLNTVQRYLKKSISLLSARIVNPPTQAEWLQLESETEDKVNSTDLGRRLLSDQTRNSIFKISYNSALSAIKREKVGVNSHEIMNLMLSIFSLCLYRSSLTRDEVVDLHHQFGIIQMLVKQKRIILEARASLDE